MTNRYQKPPPWEAKYRWSHHHTHACRSPQQHRAPLICQAHRIRTILQASRRDRRTQKHNTVININESITEEGHTLSETRVGLLLKEIKW